MRAGERQLHLRLHARDLHDAEAGRLAGDVAQQRALADARLAADDEDLALAPADRRQQATEHIALAGPPNESRPTGAGHAATLSDPRESGEIYMRVACRTGGGR